MKSAIAVILAAFSMNATPATSAPVANSCHTKTCFLRVEMKHYKRNPLPWCTWGPESGRELPEWSPRRYRVWNTGSTSPNRASGKYQIIAMTWKAFGGTAYADYAASAAPVYQERVARRIARDGLHHWVNC